MTGREEGEKRVVWLGDGHSGGENEGKRALCLKSGRRRDSRHAA